MNIVFLDAKTIGEDIDLSGYDKLGTVIKYGFSTTEEARERTKDADVVIVNKVQINETSIGEAEHLKLVCVTATGTNNLDKAYLDAHGIAWRNVAGYSTETVAQHTFAMLLFLLEKLRYYDDYVKEERYVNDVSFTHFAEHFTEIHGKTWGIIGLGAIGAMVANAACGLGMEVYGYDPYLSIDAAWNLSRTIKHSKSLDEIYSQCDYITIHVPLLDSTKKMINKEAFEKMKDGVVLLNFARDLLVDEEALIEAVESGKVKKYVTDFANETVAGREGILVTPHLGASTEESEENCAEMAVKEIRDYLENGNIKNSVNYPNCDMGTCVAVGRISLAHSNTPNMISQVTKILGSEGLNIADMTNKSKGEFAYTLIDLESAASAKALDELKEIEGMYRVRVVK